jgi:hypothetical protein
VITRVIVASCAVSSSPRRCKTLQFFGTSGTADPTTQHFVLEDSIAAVRPSHLALYTSEEKGITVLQHVRNCSLNGTVSHPRTTPLQEDCTAVMLRKCLYLRDRK